MTDFGSDVSTLPDLDLSFAPITGNRVVAEALARRFMTPNGSLPFEPRYGLDVRDWLNETVRTGSTAKLGRALEDQALQDERVLEATAQVTFNMAGSGLMIELSVLTAEGPFSLVLKVGTAAPSLATVVEPQPVFESGGPTEFAFSLPAEL